LGFTFNKGFNKLEKEKIFNNQHLIKEVDGIFVNVNKNGRTRFILVTCEDCKNVRKIRLVDYLCCKTNLCKSCIQKGDKNPSKQKYVREKLSRKGVKDTSYATTEWRKKFSEKRKGKGNPMYGKQHSIETLKKIFKYTRPNKPEKFLIELLDKHFPKQYKYIGDFSFLIGGKNPDFINKSKKKIIEHFGTYYHGKENTGIDESLHEQQRIDFFKSYGYDVLIIWENELKNIQSLQRKLIRFNGENIYG